MKKTMALIALAMVAAFVFVLVGCGNLTSNAALAKDDPIIGKWTGFNDESSTWTINQDGSLVLSVNEQDSPNYHSYAMTEYKGNIIKSADGKYKVNLNSTPKHCKYKYDGLELELLGDSLFPVNFGNSDRRSWSKH